MDEIRENGTFVRKALMVAFALAIVVSPFFYHLIPFLLWPVIIPLIALFAFVYFTGLTDFEQKRMVILNIVLALLIIGLYEGYLYIALTSDASHADVHLNITVWIVQILVINLLLIIYWSIKSLRKRKMAEQHEQARLKDEEIRRNA